MKVLNDKYFYDPKVLRNDTDLTIKDLMDDNSDINEFVGITIIETLKLERELNQLPKKLSFNSSSYFCWKEK